MATVPDTDPLAGNGSPSAVLDDAPSAPASDLAVAAWARDAEHESKSDRYLARRLANAGADYKGVALTTFFLGGAVAAVAWLATGVLIEHWAVPGGLSPAVRWAWLAAGLVALVAAAVRWVLPLVRYRVNLVYAARAIEREHPELHNDLVNTVLVKAHPEANPEKIVRSLERRTAKQLAAVPVEAVIDRTVPLRLAYVLAGLVALAGLYEVAAPKSLLVSVARLLAPWGGWAAPSRVRISEPRLSWRMPAEPAVAADQLDRRRVAVETGSATLVRGRQLVVAADIRGLRRGETPAVLVAPLRADGGVDPAVPTWRTEMGREQAQGGQRMFATVLPDATRGLDHAVEIRIAAGDAVGPPVRVAVVDAPTLLVRELRYAYPPYTHRPPETVAWQGDIRALEGTDVTVVAESNQPLEDAWIDFEGDGSRELRFTKSANDLARVTKTFQLRLKADGSGPEHASYRLVFQPKAAGSASRENAVTDPLEHRIEVVADVAPEVAIATPRESPLRVPPAAPVTVHVQAHDPDFALARVAIQTRLQGGAVGPEMILLDQEHPGMFRGRVEIVPERVGAGAGSTLEYRAVAVDNRPKEPNVSHSPWQALRIDPSAPPRPPEPPPPGQRQSDGESSPEGSGQPGRSGERGAADQDSQRGTKGGAQDSKQDEKQQEKPGSNERPNGDPGADRTAEQRGERDSGERQQPAGEKQQGSKGGQAEGGQTGDRQQQPGQQKQAGDQSGQGQNQGQGAEQGQGVGGAQGQRQGGSTPQSDGRQAAGGQPGGQQSGNGKGSRGASDNLVAADGTNDGEALERILGHRREQGGDAAGEGQGKEGQGKEGQGKEGQGKEGQGKEGQGKEGAGKEGAGKEGAGKEGAGKEGAATGAEKQPGNGPSGGNNSSEPGSDGAGDRGSGSADGQRSSKQGDQGGREGQGAATNGQASGKEGQGAGSDGRDSGSAGGSGEKPDGHAAAAQEGPEAGAGDAAGPRQGDGAGQGKGVGDTQGKGSGDAQASGASGEGSPDGSKPAMAREPGSGSGQSGSGGWAGGDSTKRVDGSPAPDGPRPSRETEWGAQDLAHARNATDLALEHLRRALQAGDTELLDRLGWTRDEAQAFLDRWAMMQRLANSGDPVERGEFERTMRSLGLRPDGVRSSRAVPTDVRGGQAEGRRSRPPSDYREQFRAYTQGTVEE